jgi:hypothetical protein
LFARASQIRQTEYDQDYSLKMNLTKCEMLLKLVLIFCQSWKVFAWLETPHWYNEYFGDGDFHEESADQIKKHLSRQDFKHENILFLNYELN